MKKALFFVVVLALVLGLTSQGLCAEPAQAPQQESILQVLGTIPQIIKKFTNREIIPALTLLVNLLVSLSKSKPVQSVLAKISFRAPDWELSDLGKSLMALLFGVLLTFLLSPARSDLGTLGKGLLIGFASIGMYDLWKFSLKGLIFKSKKA